MRAPWIFWGQGAASDYHPLVYEWQFPTFTLSTATPTLPYIGYWNVLLEFSQPHLTESNTDLQIAGMYHQWFQNTTTVPSVQGIILMRSQFRFEFGGIWRRMN
jgi:hypothetical protein